MRVMLGISVGILLSAALVFGQQQSETPKRTIFDSTNQSPRLVRANEPVAQAPKPALSSSPISAAGASSRALDALNSSQEDLNAIRDGNIRRLTSGGCAPDVSARIAELAAKLHTNAPTNSTVGSESATLALASEWYRRPGDAASVKQGKDQKDALLDAVLPGAKSAAAGGQDTASLRAELDRLLTTCPAPKR
jgi:hypothetical protein